MLKSLHHIEVRVNDFEAAVAWYRDVLGLEPVGLHDDPFCFLKFPDGAAMLALFGAGRADGQQAVTPGILVDHLDETMAILQARGVDFVSRPEGDEDEGYRIATFLDLEGNRLSIFEWV